MCTKLVNCSIREILNITIMLGKKIKIINFKESCNIKANAKVL